MKPNSEMDFITNNLIYLLEGKKIIVEYVYYVKEPVSSLIRYVVVNSNIIV